MTDPYVQVGFHCRGCGVRRMVNVRLRRANEDLIHWMEDAVGRTIGMTHQLLSPMCQENKCDILMSAPNDVSEGKGLGQVPEDSPITDDQAKDIWGRFERGEGKPVRGEQEKADEYR